MSFRLSLHQCCYTSHHPFLYNDNIVPGCFKSLLINIVVSVIAHVNAADRKIYNLGTCPFLQDIAKVVLSAQPCTLSPK